MKPEPVQPLPIAVAIATADVSRVAALHALVVKAGHVVVDAANADVVLMEGTGESTASGVPVVVLGSPDNDAAGSLPAGASVEQIDAALRAVAVGLIVRAHRESRPHGFEELRERTSHVLLTPRELDVLTAIGDGLSNKAMARRLGISLHTVKFHVESLFRKFGVRTRAEAVARGLERRVRETIDL